MKFSTNEDIAAPAGAVFDALCNFELFEQAAIRRGAEVRRRDTRTQPGEGMSWDAEFMLRGKRREVQIELSQFERPERLVFNSMSKNMLGEVSFELIPMASKRTRLKVGLEIKPLNLSSRLLVQSLRLAKHTLTKRYKKRVAQYAKTLEDRYRDGAA